MLTYYAIPALFMEIKLVPHDIKKLMKERPEMFDFADIPEDLNVDPNYQAAMDKLAPQWAKGNVVSEDEAEELKRP